MLRVAAFAGDDGYVGSVVLPRVRRGGSHPHPWVPAFAGKTDWRVQGFVGTTWNHSCERERGHLKQALETRRYGNGYSWRDQNELVFCAASLRWTGPTALFASSASNRLKNLRASSLGRTPNWAFDK